MKHRRFAWLLPLCALILTVGLWHRAHGEFSHSGFDVSIALQLAGMLNGPIAVLAFPYYSLSHGDVRIWHLAILLLAVALQWTYIGYRIDRRYMAPAMPNSRGYTVVGVLG